MLVKRSVKASPNINVFLLAMLLPLILIKFPFRRLNKI
jgi:hypothetical protein